MPLILYVISSCTVASPIERGVSSEDPVERLVLEELANKDRYWDDEDESEDDADDVEDASGGGMPLYGVVGGVGSPVDAVGPPGPLEGALARAASAAASSSASCLAALRVKGAILGESYGL